MVEEVFVTGSLVWHLHIGGQVIRTTAEHPFYAHEKGWVNANQLAIGDWLLAENGHWLILDDLLDTGEYETVYNCRVADHHTYFVGTEEWGFAVWAHNACHGHHSDPKFMGGKVNQPLTKIGAKKHQQLHKDLNNHLANYKDGAGSTMRPSSTNSGMKIRDTFSRGDRLQAMADFYKGSGAKYTQAAKDFFKQHPGLK
jgi:hypothetical protein